MQPMTRHIFWQIRLGWAVLSILVLCLAIFPIQAGTGWSLPFNLSVSAVDTEDASIAVDSSGRVHVIWSEGGEILHRFRDGSGWSAAKRVASGTFPDLAADAAGNVHLVFANQFAGSEDIYFVSWQATSGWGLPVNVSEGAGASSFPKLAIAPDGGLVVVWSVQSSGVEFIYLARSTDGWLWVSGPIPNAYGTHPAVAVAPAGNLVVAWEGPYDELGSPAEVFFSVQVGSQWTLPEDVSASPEVNSSLPSLAVGPSDIGLAWQEDVPGGQAVYLSQMTDGGWSEPQQRSGSGQALAPALAFDSLGNGHLVWATENAVQHVTWAPITGVWQPIENVAIGQVGVSNACLALRSAAHVVWLAEASADNRDLYYSTKAMVEPSPTPSVTRTAKATPTHTCTTTPTGTATVTHTSTATPTSRLSWRVFLPSILRE